MPYVSLLRKLFLAGTISLIAMLVNSFVHVFDLWEKVQTLPIFYRYFFSFAQYSPIFYAILDVFTCLVMKENPFHRFFAMMLADIEITFREIGRMFVAIFDKYSGLDKGWYIGIFIYKIIIVVLCVIGVKGICS